MGKGLASFAAGFGGGYLNASRQAELDKERQADRAMRQQEFDARMGEVNDAKNLRVSLADAARPVAVESGAGGMIRPETMDNRDVGLPENASQPNNGLSLSQYRVKDKSFDAQAPADAYAATQNTPEAVAQRQVGAYNAAGKPAEAMTLANGAASQRAAEMAQADKAWQRKISGAMMNGPDGMADLISQSEFGPMAGKTVKAVPSADGTSITYNMVNPDGTLTPSKMTFSNDQNGMIQAGYMLDRVVTPEHRYTNYATEKKLAAQQEREARRDKVTETHYNNQDEAARVRANRPVGGSGAAGQPSREERMRYTTLFQDAGRRAGEAQKALTTLQKDPMYSMAKPGSPQHEELQGLRDAIKSYGDERTMYQGMLAGSQGSEAAPAPATPSTAPAPAAPGLASVRPSTASRTPVPATQAARDKDQRFILEGELEKARQRQSTERTQEERNRTQYDIDSLTREIGRLPGSKPAAPGLANAKVRTIPNPLNGPQQISSAAERDALPKGTRYIAPNGKTYEKQ